VLAPLHRAAGLRTLTVATYQAAGGVGRDGVAELAEELAESARHDVRQLATDGAAIAYAPVRNFPAPLAHNVLPLAGRLVADESGETTEEQKFRSESRKILDIPDLVVSVTCVRVPVFTGHAMAVTASFAEPLAPERATTLLRAAEGVEVCDLPTPLGATGHDPCYVGRIRRAETVTNGLALFLVADNLRKGAALNAVQIAEEIARLG
jgi:aspartate-semialdehyde dehydrogenase